MFVVIVQRLNYSGRLSKTHNLQFIFLKHVTLKQGHGHQTLNDNVDPKQGYKYAKFKRSCFNGVREKANVNVSFKRGNMSIISLEHVRKSKIVVRS